MRINYLMNGKCLLFHINKGIAKQTILFYILSLIEQLVKREYKEVKHFILYENFSKNAW